MQKSLPYRRGTTFTRPGSQALASAIMFAASGAAQALDHTVEPGSTLFSIARQYGVAVTTLKHANGLRSNDIRTGQRLVIPRDVTRTAGEDGQSGQEPAQNEEETTRIATLSIPGSHAGTGGGGGKGKQDDEPIAEEEHSESQAAEEAPEEDAEQAAGAEGEGTEPGADGTEPAQEPPAITGQEQEHAAADTTPIGDCGTPAEAEPSEPDPHWSYDGDTGPAHWAELSPKFEQCGTGLRQTPIDVASGEAVAMGLEDVQFQYGPVEGRLVNNGHTIQVNVADGNAITVDGVTYALAQFHFHTPSEHTIDGNSYPLELHLVHKDEHGNLAVVGVMLEKGEKNPALSQVWAKLPKTAGKETALKDPIDASALLPTDRAAYRYIGSLTTPPCSEGVKWIVMKSSVTVTTKQIAAFKKLYPVNARPLQPINSRSVLIDVTTESSHASN